VALGGGSRLLGAPGDPGVPAGGSGTSARGAGRPTLPDPGGPGRGGLRGWFDAPASAAGGESVRAAVGEPTQALPLTRPVPQTVAARAVIVYEERPRRPWRLWVFTAVLVALTVGVVLGQTSAFEPTYRSTANAQIAVAPAPSVLDQPWPDAAHRMTAPLRTVRARVFEVTGASTVLHVRSADLGDRLFDVATIDRSAVPRVTETKKGARLELIRTGDAGTVGAEIQLNARVAWTLRLTGDSSDQSIDMGAGGVAGIELTGRADNVVWQLPAPKGTVRLSVTGPVGAFVVRTKPGTPVRFRLGAGAGTAIVGDRTREKLKPGAVVSTPGWGAAGDRYEVTTSGTVTSVATGRV